MTLLNKPIRDEKTLGELSGSGRRTLLSFTPQVAPPGTVPGCSSRLGTKGRHLYLFNIKVFHKPFGLKTSQRIYKWCHFEDSLTRWCQYSMPRSQNIPVRARCFGLSVIIYNFHILQRDVYKIKSFSVAFKTWCVPQYKWVFRIENPPGVLRVMCVADVRSIS